MKRSEINQIIRRAHQFLAECCFYLPPFADWGPDDWDGKGAEVCEIIETNLGWDITDFGSGNFNEVGLFLFTLRNGRPENIKNQVGKLYAEKIMISEVGQVTPMHFHWGKMEGIINRGGGRLVIELYNSTSDEKLASSTVRVVIDGVKK